MGAQVVPALVAQSSQCMVTMSVPCEVHVPGTSVSVLPSCGVPTIAGARLFTGGAGSARALAGTTDAVTLTASTSSTAAQRHRASLRRAGWGATGPEKCRNRRKPPVRPFARARLPDLVVATFRVLT